MTKQEKTALNMARIIRSQTLTLLEKLNDLAAAAQTDPPHPFRQSCSLAAFQNPGVLLFGSPYGEHLLALHRNQTP